MRKMISAFRISLDGYIEDPEAKQDWVDSWEDVFGLTKGVDLCVLGSVMYPGYEQYWSAILEKPRGKLPFSGKAPTRKEVAYARWAAKTPHVVVSRHRFEVAWKNTRVVQDVEEIRKLKRQKGKNIYVVGGALLASSLINLGVVDELRLMVQPILLGGGKLLFKGVSGRHPLKLQSVKRGAKGTAYMVYGVRR